MAVCDYLGYEGISTHSFRKWYATEIYRANGHDIVLVQRLLQHSTAATTQRYIGIEMQRMEQTISGAYTFDVKKKGAGLHPLLFSSANKVVAILFSVHLQN